MKLLNRRTLFKAGIASAPLLARAAQPAPPPQPQQQQPQSQPTNVAASAAPAGASPVAAGLAPAALVDAWRRGFAAARGGTSVCWYAGTLYAHVDGLREFPILALNAMMWCKTSTLADAIVVDWRTFGYFSDLQSGTPASHWDNVFTGRRQAVPRRFAEGPGRYRLSTHDATLALSASQVRVNRVNLTGSNTADGLMLTQIEGTLQGLPRLDGTLPPLGSSDITERQTRLQWVTPPAQPLAGVSGFFNHVYDALPPWLGFGERLGSALSKGVMRKTAAEVTVNRAVLSQIHRLFGAAVLRDAAALEP